MEITILFINVCYRVRFVIVWHLDDNTTSAASKNTPTECDSLATAVCMESDANNMECYSC